MDTLFRQLVSQLHSDDQNQLPQSPLNSSRTSSSSRSSRQPVLHHQYLPSTAFFELSQEEECVFINPHQPSYLYASNNINLFMDEDFSSSSSSSKHFHTDNPPPPPPDQSLPPIPDLFADPHRRWASDLLLDCARAVASRDSSRVQQLMWMLNELASPYGDLDQKIASYFLQALFARLTSSGPRTLRTLSSASDRTASFDSTRRTALRFQDLSPWSSFGHVASNGAILESFLHSPSSPPTHLHILDLSTTFCTQWPTLLEALATRSAADEDTPHLSITTVVPSTSPNARRVMREIAARMEKFARLMAVPFRFSVVHHPDADLSTLDLDALVSSDSSSAAAAAALAVNCVNSLHGVSPSARRREALLAKIRRLRPRVVTVVEEEAELGFDEDDEEGFLKGFREGLRFFSAYFDSLDESFPKTSNERLALERAAGRAMVDVVACPVAQSAERREAAAGWSRRMRMAGFTPSAFSDDLADDLRALLRRYKEGWSMRAAAAPEEVESSSSSGGGGGGGAGAGIFLTWREEAVVWASAWKV